VGLFKRITILGPFFQTLKADILNITYNCYSQNNHIAFFYGSLCIEAVADKSSTSTQQLNTNIKIMHKLPFDGDRPPHTSLPGSESLHVSNGNEFLPVCHRPDMPRTYWLL